jgi:hypothetical protein
MMDKDIIGAIALVLALMVQQFFSRRKGKNDNKLEQETNKLVKQSNETVNRCSAETRIVLDAIDKNMAKNDVGHLSTRLNDTVQLLATMVDHQSECIGTLNRVSSVVRSIADDLQKTDSRIVHQDIQNKINMVESLVEDVKRIVITK